MSKFTLYSLCILGIGLLLLGFQALSAVMGVDIVWEDITLKTLLREEHVEAIEGINIAVARKAGVFLMAKPLYAIFLVTGGVLFLFSGIFAKVR